MPAELGALPPAPSDEVLPLHATEQSSVCTTQLRTESPTRRDDIRFCQSSVNANRSGPPAPHREPNMFGAMTHVPNARRCRPARAGHWRSRSFRTESAMPFRVTASQLDTGDNALGTERRCNQVTSVRRVTISTLPPRLHRRRIGCTIRTQGRRKRHAKQCRHLSPGRANVALRSG